MDRAREEFEAAGVGLVLIGQLTPRDAAHFRSRREIQVPVLADEKRESYKAAGAKIATVTELIGPSVVTKGTALAARTGLTQSRTRGHPAQLGGVLVITPDGTVAWSHLSQDAGDNATPGEILAAVREAAATAAPEAG